MTYHIKDRSEAARERGFMPRILTRFTTPLNKANNTIRHLMLKYSTSNKSAGDKANFIKKALVIIAGSALANQAVNEIKDKALRRKRKKNITRIFDTVSGLFSSIYGVKLLTYPFSSKLEFGQFLGADAEEPLHALVNRTVNALFDFGIAIGAKFDDDEEKFYKFIKKFLLESSRIGGMVTGYGVSNVIQLYKAGERWVTGDILGEKRKLKFRR